MAYFTTQFSLKTEKFQEGILDKRFEIGRQIYNSLVNIAQKRYREMIKTKVYRNLMFQLSGDKNKDKPIWKQINEVRKQFGMSEYSFYKDVQKMQHHFSNTIDVRTTRSVASNLWKAYEKLFFVNGEIIYHKKHGSLNSLEGQSNTASDLKSFDMNKCNERFENFYRLHNLEVDRLTGHKNLSSIAI